MVVVTRGVIKVLMMADVDLCLKRPSTLPLSKVDKILMVIVDMGIVPRPSTIIPISQVTMVDY